MSRPYNYIPLCYSDYWQGQQDEREQVVEWLKERGLDNEAHMIEDGLHKVPDPQVRR